MSADTSTIPQHVALIMDGNRRWAKIKGLPISAGHTKAVKQLEPLIIYAKKLGIKHLTFWAFSTENWKRDKKEITTLMRIFRIFFKSSSMKRLMENGVQIKILGEIDPFPKDIRESILRISQETKDNTEQIVNIALNYGGRPEIVRAVQHLVTDLIKPADITEEIISQYLYTRDQPDPDLVIRTGGETRLSGYLPWQSVYSELYFTDIYWPDFDEKEFEKALEEYTKRQRRFGK